MRYSITLLASLVLAINGATLPNAETDGVPAGYGNHELTSGSTVEIRSTIEEVASQLDKLDLREADDEKDEFTAAELNGPTWTSLKCKVPYGWAKKEAIKHGAWRLHDDVEGNAKNGPGPGNCGRVSCSRNSAIWWCNDNTQPQSVEWSDIAEGVFKIIKKCARYTAPGVPETGEPVVQGQIFTDKNWNIIVRDAKC